MVLRMLAAVIYLLARVTTFYHPMYQYNDRLTQLFTKYKYIWLWLQCFDPLPGHHQAYTVTWKV
jgi:hypothetical protein